MGSLHGDVRPYKGGEVKPYHGGEVKPFPHRNPFETAPKNAERSMNAVINPIIAKLEAHGIMPSQDKHGKYDRRSYRNVKEHLDTYDLAAIEYTYDDVRRLLTDPWANMFRRPLLSGITYDHLRNYPASTDNQRGLRDAVIRSAKGYGWEYYHSDERQEWYEVISRIKADKHYSRAMGNTLALRYEGVAKQMYELNEDFYRDKGEGRDWITDVGHGITQVTWPAILVVPLEDEIVLKRPIRHLLVEDQIRSLWPALFRKSLGYLSYPNDDSRVCPTAEKAIEILEGNPPPDVITTDIELGKGMDGLEFAERARKLLRPRTQIYVYSSYIPEHEGRLKEMVKEGILQGYFSKQGYEPRLKAMVADETIQGYFSKHGFHIDQLTSEINKRLD
ncbi:MAG: hypothetical protein V1875_08065 [Candidatus Altiarchaeota archaeon]